MILKCFTAAILALLSGLATASGEPSLYDLDAVWHDQAGNEVKLSGFRGKPVLVAMFYAGCQTSCPMTVNLLQGIERKLPRNRKVRFVLVSLDGKADTPTRLTAFARLHHLSPQWTLLTGTADDTRDLAASLGVRFKAGANGEITHSTGLFLVDDRGVVREHMLNPKADLTALINAALAVHK